MFRRFGSRVTIVHRGRSLLSREDPDVADAVASIFREDGVDLKLETEPVRVRAVAGGRIELTVRTEGREEVLVGSHLLAATGRTPNTDRLDLPSAGVRTDERGYVVVDDRLETSVPGIYCLGDANGGPAFTHVSYDDFRILRTNLLEGGSATTRDRVIPYTVYMDPQLGRIGLGEAQAKDEGRDVRVAKLPMDRVARAIELGETRGFVKAVVDARSGQILGCAVLGIEGGELMSMFQIAMMGRVPHPVLKDAIFAHPTLAECLNNLFATLDA
jgi:pyruvate/2-oxoglutarate dehydrogenase complex dihydrolipoamide dehydrogenase (E3) component